ncbi:MAG: hypothetical protein Q8Q37_01225 [bacterium]|nr:hypothetical protein [bacterium]
MSWMLWLSLLIPAGLVAYYFYKKRVVDDDYEEITSGECQQILTCCVGGGRASTTVRLGKKVESFTADGQYKFGKGDMLKILRHNKTGKLKIVKMD